MLNKSRKVYRKLIKRDSYKRNIRVKCPIVAKMMGKGRINNRGRR